MLATDVAPNRMQRAKLAILDFVQRRGRGRVGLVAFAGQALSMALRVVHPAIAMGSIMFLGIIAFAIRSALFPGQKSSYEESESSSSSWSYLSLFSRSKAVDLERGF